MYYSLDSVVADQDPVGVAVPDPVQPQEDQAHVKALLRAGEANGTLRVGLGVAAAKKDSCAVFFTLAGLCNWSLVLQAQFSDTPQVKP